MAEYWEQLLSNDMSKVAAGLKQLDGQKNDKIREFAEKAMRYYRAEHDILQNKIFYLDEHDHVVEDLSSANVRIPHPFFMEQVDQKVQHLLSNDVEFKTENEALEKALADYLDDDFQLFLDEITEAVSVKGAEYAYVRTTSNQRIKFETSDLLSTTSIYDSSNNEVAIVRKYTRTIQKGDKNTTLTYAEVYTDKDVRFFVKEDSKQYELDTSKKLNPQPHVLAIKKDESSDEETALGLSYGRIPFFRMANNRTETSDLVPIKELIDDYDRMSSFLSSNLENYDKPIYVVSGYQGEDMKKIKQRIKAIGAIKVGAPNTPGDVQIRTYQIPYEARKAKMEMDKEAIYKFGMAFDSSKNDGSNITNVVIESRYSLLNMKCNKIEPRLRSLIKWCLELILRDIERRTGTAYDINEIEIVINRSTLINMTDEANIKLLEAQAKQALMGALVAAAAYLPNEEVVKQICEYFELDFDEINKLLAEQDAEGLEDEADDQATRPVATGGPQASQAGRPENDGGTTTGLQ